MENGKWKFQFSFTFFHLHGFPKVPGLFLYGGNWYTAPSLLVNMDSKPATLANRLYAIQRNKAYDVVLTQTKHLDKVKTTQHSTSHLTTFLVVRLRDEGGGQDDNVRD